MTVQKLEVSGEIVAKHCCDRIKDNLHSPCCLGLIEDLKGLVTAMQNPLYYTIDKEEDK